MRLFKFLLRTTLFILPCILFPNLNVRLFRWLGYDISVSARIYSSVQIMGDILVNIGDDTFIGHQTLITGGGAKITIGNFCDISDRVIICCGTHEIDPVGIRTAGTGFGKDIAIEDGVWIGIGSLIQPGVRIGKKSIIAAGTVVNKNVEPYTVVGGNPMRVIKDLRSGY